MDFHGSLSIDDASLDARGGKKTKGDPAESWRLSKTKMAFCAFSKLIYFAAVAYSVFLPLKLGTIW
ncbi:MAG: hypothetical protein JSW72_02915, partial [Candidatus Bathyarchaeota archaeon]